MSEMAQSARVVVIADVTNLFFAARHAYPGTRVNYNELLKGVVAKRTLSKALAFLIQKADVDQTRFHDALTHCGFEIRVKETKPQLTNGLADKLVCQRVAWDMGIPLVLETLHLASKADVVVIASCDGAFSPLVHELKNRKHTFGHPCVVEVVGFDGPTMSNDLLRYADKFVKIPQAWMLSDEKSRRPENLPQQRQAAPPPPPPQPVPVSAGEERLAQLVGPVDYDKQQPESNVHPRLARRH